MSQVSEQLQQTFKTFLTSGDESDKIMIRLDDYKNFDCDFINDMWAYHRKMCLPKGDELPEHMQKEYENYIKNPNDKLYKDIKPLFDKITDDQTKNIALNFATNKRNESGCSIIKYDNEYYISTIKYDPSVLNDKLAKKGLFGHFIFVFFVTQPETSKNMSSCSIQ